MKKLISLIGIFILSYSLVQAQEEPKTLLSNVKPGNVGYLVEINAQAASLADANLWLSSVRVGVVFDDQISVGAFYRYTINNPIPSMETLAGHYTPFDSYGGFVEYTLHSDKLFHLTFPLYFGRGELETDHEDFSPELGEANFFIIEPGVLLEANVTKDLRLNAGVLYGFSSNFDYRYLNQQDLQGLRFQVGIKAGLFKK
jgi:hypothetical protein